MLLKQTNAAQPPHAASSVPFDAANELELHGVGKRYGHTVAVEDLSLAVRRGEFLTILGPSGSGKTTLLHMIAGFLYPTSGSIVYRGVDITYMPAHLRNMGMVFQNYALFPHMTVAQNLAFPLRMRRLGKRETDQRVREALDLVGLAGYASRLPAQLSGGQQQRVAVARALVYRPSLLLMDEPLGALDKYLRERLQVEIKRIQRATGITIVYVTHDQQEALSMSDRIAVMSSSRLRAIGTSREIYERPSSRFIAEFIGDCNFLAGRVVGSSERSHQIEVAEGVAVSVAAAKQRFAAHQPVTVCIRPESISCSVEPYDERVAPMDGAHVTLPGVVTEVAYLGDVIRYELAVPNADSNVRLSTKSLKLARTPVFSRGERVVVRWNVDDAWAIDETADPH